MSHRPSTRRRWLDSTYTAGRVSRSIGRTEPGRGLANRLRGAIFALTTGCYLNLHAGLRSIALVCRVSAGCLRLRDRPGLAGAAEAARSMRCYYEELNP